MKIVITVEEPVQGIRPTAVATEEQAERVIRALEEVAALHQYRGVLRALRLVRELQGLPQRGATMETKL